MGASGAVKGPPGASDPEGPAVGSDAEGPPGRPTSPSGNARNKVRFSSERTRFKCSGVS